MKMKYILVILLFTTVWIFGCGCSEGGDSAADSPQAGNSSGDVSSSGAMSQGESSLSGAADEIYLEFADMIDGNLVASETLAGNTVNFRYDGEPGNFRVFTKNILDGQMAGEYAYKVLALMIEREQLRPQTGEESLYVTGEQDGEVIFRAELDIDNDSIIVLAGVFEGMEFDLTRLHGD